MARTFMKGSEAVAEAAVRAGCRFFAGYPITPATEIAELSSRLLPLHGGVYMQMEDELASKLNLDKSQNHFIRLERIRVNREAQEGEVSLPGALDSREYYGLYIKYYIRCAGQIIKVIERNDGINLYEPGQQVTVGIHVRNLMSYPRQ